VNVSCAHDFSPLATSIRDPPRSCRCCRAFIIQSYGKVLSPLPGADEQGNLSRALGSVVAIACLRTEGRVGPQLTSHVFGLLKARTAQNLGEEDRWLASDEGTEWVIRTIDTLLDVVMAERREGGVNLNDPRQV